MAPYPLTVFFDGACPVCAREIARMKRCNRREHLTFCDFSRPDYDAATTGLIPETLGRAIHARWADGNVITGIEVFRAMWEAIGWSALARLSRLPMIEQLLLRTYAWFARNRLWLTGRGSACSGDVCASPPPSRCEPRNGSPASSAPCSVITIDSGAGTSPPIKRTTGARWRNGSARRGLIGGERRVTLQVI
ncbi:MAG: DUF393 domain-containing protein [Nitrospira defluvii]|nr:DUF393 domain-containing protein [Nitrospira defluvii]